MSERYLGKLLIARTAQGGFAFVGRCVSYCEAPTVEVELPSGRQMSWRADMCQVVNICDEAVQELIPTGQEKPGDPR